MYRPIQNSHPERVYPLISAAEMEARKADLNLSGKYRYIKEGEDHEELKISLPAPPEAKRQKKAEIKEEINLMEAED
jgi:hypothetical protein